MSTPSQAQVDPRVAEDLKKYKDRIAGLMRPELIRMVEIPRPAPEALAKLHALPDLSSMVADVLDEYGLDTAISASALPPLAPGQRIVGPAITSRHSPARHTIGHNIASGKSPSMGGIDKVMLSQPGDVMVIDARSCGPASNFGGLVAVAAATNGLAGVVVDGYVRDADRMRELKLPVWARGVTPRTGKFRIELVEFNGPVEIGGVQVRPGDVIVGDSDGLVVLPADLVEAVAEKTTLAAANEARLIDALARGASAKEGAEILPPNKW